MHATAILVLKGHSSKQSLSLWCRLRRNKNVSVGEWHFQAARGRRNCFFFPSSFFGATGHSSRRSGWMARYEINTSSSGPILSFDSTGFDPWNWKSSPPKWTAVAGSSPFLQHSDSTRHPTEKQTLKKKPKQKKTFSWELCVVSYTLYIYWFEETIYSSLVVFGLSFTKSLAASLCNS